MTTICYDPCYDCATNSVCTVCQDVSSAQWTADVFTVYAISGRIGMTKCPVPIIQTAIFSIPGQFCQVQALQHHLGTPVFSFITLKMWSPCSYSTVREASYPTVCLPHAKSRDRPPLGRRLIRGHRFVNNAMGREDCIPSQLQLGFFQRLYCRTSTRSFASHLNHLSHLEIS